MSTRLTPKFVTPSVCSAATDAALVAASSLFGDAIKELHVVVLVPSIADERTSNYPNWPAYTIEPFPVFEKSVFADDSKTWKYPLKDIAHCKSLQLWNQTNTGGPHIQAHLLFPGDTPYWGGVARERIVVGCSGAKEYQDRMIAGFIADAIIALAHQGLDESGERGADRCFLV